MSDVCIRLDVLRRPPALKTSVVASGCFEGVAWMLGLGYLDRDVGKAISVVLCSMARLRLWVAFGVCVGLLVVITWCLEFVGWLMGICGL